MRAALKEMSLSRVYVVFENDTNLRWLRFLKKGFRHCYLLLCIDENTWLEINPASNYINFVIHKTTLQLNYIDHLCGDKSKIILGVVLKEQPLSTAPIGLFTCVEFVKRSLGIHSFFTITPHQLYKKVIHNLKY